MSHVSTPFDNLCLVALKILTSDHGFAGSNPASNMENIQKIASKLTEEDEEINIFSFLAKKVNTFSKPVQDWMEDEIKRLHGS